jgi:cytochrome P450
VGWERAYPRGEPLLGSLRRLRNDPLGLFVEGATAHDLVPFRAAYRRVFLVVGPELIAQVAVDGRERYAKGVSYDALRVPIGDALLTIDGPPWKPRRRLLGPLFTRRALLEQLPTIAGAVESQFGHWDRLAASAQPINVVAEMNRLAFDVVGRMLLGTELGESMSRLDTLISDASGWVANRTRALVPLPPVLPTPRNRAYQRAETEIRRFTERAIETRRRDGVRADMVSRLMSARDADGGAMGDREVRDEVIAFLMAGHQTTGAALAWTWYLLGRHPEVERVLAREVAGTAVSGAPEDLERLPYVGAVLNEAMRLYPPGWAFTRTPLADDRLDGHRVRRGSIVVISSYANQRNPRFWTSPDAFDPARFAPGRPAPNPYHYFPFGIGPHACIGKHLALIEAKLAVALLARRYRLEPLSRRAVGATPAITLTPREPILMRVHRRGDSRGRRGEGIRRERPRHAAEPRSAPAQG